MRLHYIFLVPDAEPNADSTAHLVEMPHWLRGPELWNWKPKPGFHIVKYSSYDPQDGGPMHAHFLPQSTPEYIWEPNKEHARG